MSGSRARTHTAKRMEEFDHPVGHSKDPSASVEYPARNMGNRSQAKAITEREIREMDSVVSLVKL